MNAYYFALCPLTGQMSEEFKYKADAKQAAIDMLKETVLYVVVCRAEVLVEHVDRKAGTYSVTPLQQ